MEFSVLYAYKIQRLFNHFDLLNLINNLSINVLKIIDINNNVFYDIFQDYKNWTNTAKIE